MATPGIPTNLYVTQANRQVYLQWDITVGATSYNIQRSLDGVTYTSYATVTVNNYLDTAVTAGTLYYYNLAAVNLSGTGLYTAPAQIIPTPSGEMSLGELRLAAQQRADLVGSNFVTLPEWNSYINQSMMELYDLLITSYEDYFIATPAQFLTNGVVYLNPLPDGVTPFYNGITGAPGYIAPPFYKLRGVDLALNTSTNAWVTVSKFMFESRNRYLYLNSSSTIYGVFNAQYRLLGNAIEFIPTPVIAQKFRLWYIPRIPELLADTDLTTTGISGWSEYIIIDAAIKAMQKEESDVSVLMAQKAAIILRIQSSAVNRDANQPDRISDTKGNQYGNGADGAGGYGPNGPLGGWMVSAPIGLANYGTHSLLTDFINSGKFSLTYAALTVVGSYLGYLAFSKLSSRVSFSGVRNLISNSISTFANHVMNIIGLGSKKQVVGPDAFPIVAAMTNNKTVGNNTVVKFPTESMDSDIFLKSSSAGFLPSSSIRNANDSISSGLAGLNLASPFPASISLVNFTPESVLQSTHDSNVTLNSLESKAS